MLVTLQLHRPLLLCMGLFFLTMDYVVPDAYLKQRKSRMGDAIFDYLSDDSVSARNIYEDMLSEIDIIIDYHKGFFGQCCYLEGTDDGSSSCRSSDTYGRVPRGLTNFNISYILGT